MTIRPARVEDTPEILDLIAASYGQPNDSGRPQYWRWKHIANPFGTSPCLVAELKGRIVGVRAFLRWTWRSGSREVRSVRAVDTATHPEWRGQGIFSQLTKRLVEQVRHEGVSFVYNTPNALSMPGYLKLGWSLVTRVPLWVRPLRFSGLLRGALGTGPVQPPTFRGMDRVGSVLDDPRLPAFLLDVASSERDDRYQTVRTAGYLRWRYAEIPRLSYWARFDVAEGVGALVIARGKIRGGFREVTISDLLVTPTSKGVRVGRALVSNLLREVDADYVAACAARGTPERRVLSGTGFLPVPHCGPNLIARDLNAARLDPSRWVNWRCSVGDLELF